jgi:hypothetical protein
LTRPWFQDPLHRNTSAGATGSIRSKNPYDRFKPFGTPPAKQGDYAYLMHIVRSRLAVLRNDNVWLRFEVRR